GAGGNAAGADPRVRAQLRRVPHAAVRPGDGADHGVAPGPPAVAPRTNRAPERARQGCRDQGGNAMNAPATLLSVRNLTMRFGGLTATGDLSPEALAGKIPGVIGPNGAGKTTLFNCLSGFYKSTTATLRLAHPSRGKVRLETLPSHRVARDAQVLRTFQNIR